MCGIVGGIGPSAPNLAMLNTQLRSIEHRGPDDKDVFLSNQIGIGMCRLAIVEVLSGKQPATDKEEFLRIVWNGEIYNYRELRAEMEKNGVRFRDASESEVLLNLYLEYGLDFFEKLNGMFAIAIYDSRDFSIHLIRDRMGKKPLWYSQVNDGTCYFASEVRALLPLRQDRTLRTEAISEVLQYGYVIAPNSAFNEISQIPPASILTWKEGKICIREYWKPDFENKVAVSYEEALETTKAKIEGAVKRRLMAERPIGAFLSGGIDSSTVTAFMVKNSIDQVKTYSIGFNNEAFDESNHARKVANFLGTDHHELIIDADPTLVIEKVSQVLDQPFADSSIIPTYLLAEFARGDLVVALGGDGGDEVFGGYDRYFATPLLQRVNSLLGFGRTVMHLVGSETYGSRRKLRRLGSQLSPKPSLAARYSSIISLTQPNELIKLINPNFFTNQAEIRFINHFESGKKSNFDRMIDSDFKFYLPGDLLVKADLATMANGLELRSPLLDVEVVQWGISLPTSYKVKGLETKHILKDVARSLISSEIIDRPKMGFGIPRADWLRTGLKEMLFDTLTDRTAIQRDWFNESHVKALLRLHMEGQDRDSILWPLFILELWARTWLD